MYSRRRSSLYGRHYSRRPPLRVASKQLTLCVARDLNKSHLVLCASHTDEEIHAPAPFAVPLEWVPAACFSLSTAVFQTRTISLASSETSFAACERNFPPARPALLSCGDEKKREVSGTEKESRDLDYALSERLQ